MAIGMLNLFCHSNMKLTLMVLHPRLPKIILILNSDAEEVSSLIKSAKTKVIP